MNCCSQRDYEPVFCRVVLTVRREATLSIMEDEIEAKNLMQGCDMRTVLYSN